MARLLDTLRQLIPFGRGWFVAAGAAGVVALGGGMALGAWNHVCSDCPSIAQIYAFEPKEATRVHARDGSLLAQFAVEKRTAIPFSAFPPYLPQAFVAVEDRRFWSHRGIDVPRTLRAGIEFIFKGYEAAGGSTITQQLAGNMFSEAVDRQVLSVRRKLKEMRVAVALERAYTKREILQAYLNQINFGHGRYGVQSAARYYFAKDVRELNLPEAATLAALPRAPAHYSPIRHPERALRRRNLVLDLMAKQGMIPRGAAERTKAYPLGVTRERSKRGTAPYFVEEVRRKLLDRYGPRVYEAGLRVHTTLDARIQEVADSALQAQLRWVEEQPAFQAPAYGETREWPEERLSGERMPYVQGAFVALDAGTGEILALIGGRDFEDSEFNRITQARRQPGSVFKPFVYTAAIASGIPASDVVYDSPVEILMPDSTIYSPKNFGDVFHGPVTIREALYRSINVVAVKVAHRLVGEETVAQYAHRLGIRTPIPRVPSIGIGSAEVIPLEVAEAFTTFANLGVRVGARVISRIEGPDGTVLWESRPSREDVLGEQAAWIVLSMLRDVVDNPRGTGRVVRSSGLPSSVPAAGKTGTTNEATDAWFVGFTPEIVTLTWVGFDRPERLHYNAQGGVDAAPVNAEVLKWLYSRRPAPPEWERPAGLVEREVDGSTGQLSTPWCPAEEVYTETYLPGTEPTTRCTRHGPWEADGFSGEAPEAFPTREDTAAGGGHTGG